MQKPTESPAYAYAKTHLTIRQRGEFLERVESLCSKNNFSEKQIQLLTDSILSPNAQIKQNYEKFAKEVKKNFKKLLKNNNYTKIEIDSILKKMTEKIIAKASSYTFTPNNTIRVKSSTYSNQILATKYDRGEEIPLYVQRFDVKAQHSMNPAEYLDVRLSRKMRDSIDFVNRVGSNIEIFIGPTNDLKDYYGNKGYELVGLFGMQSSNRFYYFLNPEDPKDAKVVIAGVANSSRMNHLLLQLKFADIALDKVKIRATFENALAQTNRELVTELGRFGPPPKIAFIGNRTQVLIELAKCLYPIEMQNNSYDFSTTTDKQEKEEKMANELLSGCHSLKTVDIGGIYKFSYFTAQIHSEPVGIIAMRMPNGSLSGEAVKALIDHGTKNIVMIGAGGSLDKTAGVGSYQSVIASTYVDKTIYIPSENRFELPEIPNLTHKKDVKNVTVDSPLVENKEWLRKVSEDSVGSVDVETYHIFKACYEKIGEGYKDLKIFSGLFTSDVLGEHPLEDKINVNNAWLHLPSLIQTYFNAIKIEKKNKNIKG